MAETGFRIARPDIIRHFDAHPRQRCSIMRHSQRILSRATGLLAAYARDFDHGLHPVLDRLEAAFGIRISPFQSPYKKKKSLRVGARRPFYEVVLGISPKCYFSYYSAVKIRGLTEQTPKTFYINEEQRLESWLAGKLTQATIDAAFRRPVRATRRIAADAQSTGSFFSTGRIRTISESLKRTSAAPTNSLTHPRDE